MKMTTVTLPTTLEEARASLDGLEALLTAKGWERAAIVYAFTYEAPNQHDPLDEKSSGRLPISKFAELGIAGLTTRDTVRRYRSLWAGHGNPDIGPGDKVTLPTIGFPPEDANKGSRVSSDPKQAVAQLVDKHGLETVAEVVAESDDLGTEVVAELDRTGNLNPVLTKVTERRQSMPRPPKPRDWDTDVINAITVIATANTARREGKWEPSAMTVAGFHWLTQLLLGLDLAPDADLLNMDDIYAFLAGVQ